MEHFSHPVNDERRAKYVWTSYKIMEQGKSSHLRATQITRLFMDRQFSNRCKTHILPYLHHQRPFYAKTVLRNN